MGTRAGVFRLSGVIRLKLFLSPHNDDETLFGAFTILRDAPLVAVVFDSCIQGRRGTGITASLRRNETCSAMELLGARVEFIGCPDFEPNPVRVEQLLGAYGRPDVVYAPAVEATGHPQHNLVGEIAARIFPNVVHYMTYTPTGKSTGRPVLIEDGAWIGKKLRALACYESQHQLDSRIGCWPHFTRDLNEYYL